MDSRFPRLHRVLFVGASTMWLFQALSIDAVAGALPACPPCAQLLSYGCIPFSPEIKCFVTSLHFVVLRTWSAAAAALHAARFNIYPENREAATTRLCEFDLLKDSNDKRSER